jgi:hypothetical protein
VEKQWHVASGQWQAIITIGALHRLLVTCHSSLATAFILAGYTADRELESARLSSPCPEGQSKLSPNSLTRLWQEAQENVTTRGTASNCQDANGYAQKSLPSLDRAMPARFFRARLCLKPK